MNLVLLLPAGLAALAALLLPLLIHLARRSEHRPTSFAALRWLRARPRPRNRVRFDEWPLLLLRLALLALLALLLARPALYGAAGDTPWVAVVPGVSVPAARRAVVAPKARWRWLAPGFPSVEEPAPRGLLQVSSLLRELDAELPASAPLTVVAPAQLGGLDAQRVRLSRAVAWQVLPGAAPLAASVPAQPAPRLVVRYSPDSLPALRYLRAAHAAWSTGGSAAPLPAAAVGQALPPLAASQALVWLAPGPLPAEVEQWIAAGGTALLDTRSTWAMPVPMSPLWSDGRGAALAEGAGYGKGRLLRFTHALAPAQMPQLLEADFPRQLRTLFEAAPPPPSRGLAADHAPQAGAPAWAPKPRELQPWLMLAIALLFLCERWLATSPRRKVGA